MGYTPASVKKPSREGRIMPQFRNLVFEGGGVWGIAYEGVLAQLHVESAIDFQAIDRVGGASAGAITACLLAVGYTAAELGEILKRTNFKGFQDEDLGFARDTARLLTEYGWYKGNEFRKWIRGLIRDKVRELSAAHGVRRPDSRPTFAELAAWQKALAKRGRRLPALYVVGSNLSRQRREIYSAERGHSPKLHIDDAVRRSMSIPLFFACARGDGRDVIVDGGVTWNFPVDLFDDERYLSETTAGKPISYASRPRQVFNTETLGFRLDTSKELQWNLKDWANEPMEIDNIVKYGWALAAFIRAVANKVHLHKNDWTRTVFVDVGDEIGFTDFDLGEDQQAALVAAGREGVRKYLAWYRSKSGVKEIERIYRDMA
jgi:NTE family protein